VNVLVVSGIWPPDVGGPATHAPEAADGLAARGHAVEVVTTADTAPASRPYRVHWVSRRLPPGIRHAAVSALVARRARHADVVYATSMLGRSAAGAAIARKPLVMKVAGDAGFERSRRRGLFAGTLAEFQTARLPPVPGALRRARTAAARRAAHIVCPSEFLRAIVIGWGISPSRVSTIPNTTPAVPALAPPGELRARLGVDGRVLAFAGRLTAAKELDVALAAVDALDGVTLVVAGDGEDRERLERRAGPRVRFLGAVPRDGVLELFRAADAAVLTSAWENFPHTLVEALAVGTPVIATNVGGVPEIVTDGENGLLVPPGDAAAFAAAVRRFFADDGLRTRLRDAAAPSVERFAPERVLDELEAVLRQVGR
jgi:glycosyltransferase involved in cell wall biosynthesis